MMFDDIMVASILVVILLIANCHQLSAGDDENVPQTGRNEMASLVQDLRSLNEKFDRFEKKLVYLKQKSEQFDIKFDRLEHKMNNAVDILSEVVQKQLETHEQVNKIDNAMSAIQSSIEQVQKICAKNVSISEDQSQTQIGCSTLSIDNADVIHLNLSFVNVSCLPGFQFNTNQYWIITQCHDNNTWSPMPNKCTRFISHFAHTVSENEEPVALALLRDELFVACYGDDHISVYNTSSLQLKQRFTILGFSGWSYSLAVCPRNNYLYVSDWYNDCIHVVDLSSGNNNSTSWHVGGLLYGIAITRANNLLVSFRRLIQEYTADRTLIREILDDNSLWQVVETRNGTLIASRYGPIHGIAELTLDGEVLRSYGGSQSGSGQGQMDTPRSVAIHSEGYIIVADQNNNRIQVVNPSLTTAQTLQIADDVQLNGTFALCYDESRGRIYVGEGNGRKRLLAFDNVINLGALFD